MMMMMVMIMMMMKVNEKFDQLCDMLDLGRSTRVEKLTILTEAIRVVHVLEEENVELKGGGGGGTWGCASSHDGGGGSDGRRASKRGRGT